ncbi:MAG TPA: choice-of-anchor tandem repeat GloVer-containing protein [Mycobacterium sp.]|nr:choice-of-anchor tandem repeat GloVer-containing protein [Mycobacterium sp.]
MSIMRWNVALRSTCARRAVLGATIVALWLGPAAANFTVLYAFTGGSDGADPGAPLLLGADGSLLGTASGGARGNGVVFKLSPASSASWSLTVLYTFPNSPPALSVNPGLAVDGQGRLYGSANESQTGFAFSLAPPISLGSWTFSWLATFPGVDSRYGGGPTGVLVVDRAGNVTGVTQAGGDQSGQFPCQCGVAYELPATTAGRRAEDVLYTFTSVPNGDVPVAGLTPGATADVFYGTTWLGGTGQCLDGSDVTVVGCGTVYRLARSEGVWPGVWAETTLYSFRTHEGNQPVDPVVLRPDGALYGFAGVDVYRLAPEAGGHWRKRTIYSFPGGITGTAPTGAPVFDEAGNMYGATRSFGVNGPATVFRLSPPEVASEQWTATTLATLPGGFNAPQPWGGVIRGPDGKLYGAARQLGAETHPPGYIFAVTP